MTKTDTWQTRPLVREGAPKRQDSNFVKKNFWSNVPDLDQDILTDWLTVSRNVTLTLTLSEGLWLRHCWWMISALTWYSVWCCELEFLWNCALKEVKTYRFIIGGCVHVWTQRSCFLGSKLWIRFLERNFYQFACTGNIFLSIEMYRKVTRVKCKWKKEKELLDLNFVL
jgi:hypothetical protein